MTAQVAAGHAPVKQGWTLPPTCIECANTAALVTGKRIYPHRPDLYGKSFWLCECGAYCGCHPGTTDPLGYPCGPATRQARSRAHAAFDPLWRGKGGMSRGDAYRWLARRLGIDKRDCHIGMMDAQMADATARFATAFARERETTAAPCRAPNWEALGIYPDDPRN